MIRNRWNEGVVLVTKVGGSGRSIADHPGGVEVGIGGIPSAVVIADVRGASLPTTDALRRSKMRTATVTSASN